MTNSNTSSWSYKNGMVEVNQAWKDDSLCRKPNGCLGSKILNHARKVSVEEPCVLYYYANVRGFHSRQLCPAVTLQVPSVWDLMPRGAEEKIGFQVSGDVWWKM